MSVDTAVTSNIYQFREASGEMSISNKPQQTPHQKFNKQYLQGISDGYIKNVDLLIEQVNLNDAIDSKIRHKILALMISLVLDNDDLAEIKKTSKIKETSLIIPNMTEVQFINDIPFDLDIIEKVFKYILQILKGTDFLRGSQFGEIPVSGVYFDNIKDFNDVFTSELFANEKNSQLVQDIDVFNKKNRLIRKRMLEFVNKGKAVDKKSEIKIRREYKFDVNNQSFVKRPKPIAKKVYDLLGEKLYIAYESLYSSIK